MSITLQSPRRIYLDHAAASPLAPAVLAAMLPYLTTTYGNPSAIHAEGQEARAAVEAARLKIARTLGIKTAGIVFTGSGTESNNLALLGHIEYLRAQGREYTDMEVVTTKIEHPSVMMVMQQLERKGVLVRYVVVTETGAIDQSDFEAALTPKTVLITFAYVNSEVGIIQAVARLVRKVRQFEREHVTHIFVHLDAAQAPLWLPCGLEQLGVDCLALDAGKCGGPKGVGVLALRQAEQIQAVVFGGGQEAGLRPGTENVAGIVGAAAAIDLAQAAWEVRSEGAREVWEATILYLREVLPNALINGPEGLDRVANNINISLPGLDTEYAVVYLDAKGVAASTKSACAGAGSGISYVVETMTGDLGRAQATIRLTFGIETTAADLRHALDVLVAYCAKMKNLTQ